MYTVTATDLVQWADRRESQGLLPQLIRRLIWATIDHPLEVDFPAGDSVGRPGWDGVVRVEIGNAFVPSGRSLWEVGTEKDAKKKANGDYAKRTEDPGGFERSQAVFMFVTPRRWRDKSRWATQCQAEGIWTDVRALDGDDLEQWLEQAPAVSVWLASIMGRVTPGIHLMGDYWRSYSTATRPPLGDELLLAGREEESEKIKKWLEGNPALLELQGESPEEAIAFICAVLETMPEEGGDYWRTQSIILDEAGTWRSITGRRQGLLVIPRSGDPEAVTLIKNEGCWVLLPLGLEARGGPNILRLPRIPGELFEASLEKMGISRQRARDLCRESGCSLAVLRRRLAEAPSLAMPAWAKPESGRDLIPALLAGAWDEEGEADREVLASMGGRDYSQVSANLTRWISVSESPLRKVGAIWKLTSPLDAWFLLARYLSRNDTELFKNNAKEVLCEDDPRFELPPESRWAAGLHEKTRRYSNWLRVGLAEALGLVAIFGDRASVGLPCRPQDFANQLVGEFLLGASESRWYSLQDLLPTLAEAAPDVFLRAVEDSLQENPPPVMSLFVEDGLFGGASHSHLLWALEVLAWEPLYLGRVTAILGHLARIDPGGRYANRPLNSLRHIFLSWQRHTSANTEQRLAALDMLLQSEPDIGWKLLLLILPQDHDTSGGTSKPRWRDWVTKSESISSGEYEEYTDGLYARFVEQAEISRDRWPTVIEKYNSLPSEIRRRILADLRALAEQSDAGANHHELRESLRGLVHRHRQWPTADWAVPRKEVDELGVILQELDSREPVERFLWLFESDWPELPRKELQDYDRQKEAISKARRGAVRVVYKQSGVGGIFNLARAVKYPGLVGVAVAEGLHRSEIESKILEDALSSQEDNLRIFSMAFVREMSAKKGEGWALKKLSEAREKGWPHDKVVALLCGLPFSPATWQRASDIGAGVSRDYWAKVIAAGTFEDKLEVEAALKELLQVGRATDACWLAWLNDPQLISAEVVAQILEQLAVAEQGDGVRVPRDYEIKKLLESLQERGNFDESRLMRLEWMYFPALRRGRWRPRALHQRLSSDPQFFSLMIVWIFRSRDESAAANHEQEGLEPEQRQRRALTAYQLLESWSTLPGTEEDGSVNERRLWDWIVLAREHCRNLGREKVCDERIGQILAQASVDKEDNVWPIKEVRSVIERARSRDLEVGIRLGVYSRRGVHSRTLGGQEERELQARYNRYAEATALSWPQTSSVLRGISEMYASDAHREELHSELDEFS